MPPFFFLQSTVNIRGQNQEILSAYQRRFNSFEGVIGDPAWLSAQEEALKEWKSWVIGTESPAQQFPGAAGGKEQVGKKRAQRGRLENTPQLINSPNFFNKQAE